jgi:choline dehydrogenase-like flavoprotein
VVSAGVPGLSRWFRHPPDLAASGQPGRGIAALGRAAPRFVYNFFTAPNDLPTLRQGFKLARELVNHKALDPYRGEAINPSDKVQSDAEIDAWLRDTVITAHHPCGTCPMGSTPDTVLDPQMRVRGVENLRVVDASAMPDLVSAHINACVLMMAEKASDIIRGRQSPPAAMDA